jgi:hypothetical protein
MKKSWLALTAHVQLLGILFGALVALGCMYVFRLGSLTYQHVSTAEFISHASDTSLHAILHNPLNAPYKLLDYLFLLFNAHSVACARLSSVAFAIAACALFFIIMLRWHGRRTAILSTTLFGTSGWLLHVGRLADGNSALLLIPLGLILFASWLNTTERHGAALLYMTAASGLALFTPGAIWFLVAAYILIWEAVSEHITESKLWEKTLSIIVLLYFAVILVYVFYHTPHLYKTWLGLPAAWPSPLTALKQWVDTILFLFVRGPSNASMWLAHMPILDIFTAAMFLIGGYFYSAHYKNLRTQVLALFLVIGSALVALSGASAMNFIVPIIYLIAGTGLTYFLRKWLTVFPRNPLARGFGIGLIVIVVVAAALYHIRSYFVAWHHSPNTAQAFRKQL